MFERAEWVGWAVGRPGWFVLARWLAGAADQGFGDDADK